MLERREPRKEITHDASPVQRGYFLSAYSLSLFPPLRSLSLRCVVAFLLTLKRGLVDVERSRRSEQQSARLCLVALKYIVRSPVNTRFREKDNNPAGCIIQTRVLHIAYSWYIFFLPAYKRSLISYETRDVANASTGRLSSRFADVFCVI